MKNLSFLAFFFLTIGICSIVGCGKDNPTVDNDEELITTVTYVLTPQGGGIPVTMKFTDIDGAGGASPIVSNGALKINTTYEGVLTFANESGVLPEDITTEITTEAKDHQIFFQVESGLNATVTYNDVDGDAKPLGLKSLVTTTTASSGTFKIILRHNPDKSAAGVSAGDITNAGGETDIEVEFDVIVQN